MFFHARRLSLIVGGPVLCVLEYIGLIYGSEEVAAFCIIFPLILAFLGLFVYLGRKLGVNTLFR